MKKYLITSLLTLLVLTASLLAQPTPVEIRLATSSSGGQYNKLGWILKNRVAAKYQSTIKIAIDSSRGSIDNALWLGNNDVQMAFIQEDIASYFKTGKYLFQAERYDNLKVIAMVKNSEKTHIFLAHDSTIDSIANLRGKRIAVGARRSGTAFNADAILRAYGLDSLNCQYTYLSIPATQKALANNQVDAAFFTANAAAPFIDEIKSSGFPMLAISAEKIQHIRKSYPKLFPDSVNSVDGEKVIPTLGVRTLLVARKDVPKHVAYKIAKTIFTASSPDDSLHKEFAYYDGDEDLHAGAKMFYKDQGKYNLEFSDLVLRFLTIGLPVVVALFLLLYWKHVRNMYRWNIYFRLSFILILFFVIGTVGTYYFERDVNESFEDLLGSFWTTIIYLFVGFEGSNPITLGGKISSLFILVGSVGVLGSVAGNFAAVFLQEKGDKIPMDSRDHIVICYWNNRGDDIVRELRHSEHGKDAAIYVLHEGGIDEGALRKKSYYQDVFFLRDDPTSSEALQNARVIQSKSVIILSDANNDKPDPQTIICCLAIDKMAKAHVRSGKKIDSNKKSKPHIIAELMDRGNRELAKQAGADEVVSAGFYRTGIMLQSALYHGLSDIFHELLQYENTKNSIFIVKLSEVNNADKYIQKTFAEVAQILNNERAKANSTILIGVIRDGIVVLNPQPAGKGAEFDTFKKEDALIVLAGKFPRL